MGVQRGVSLGGLRDGAWVTDGGMMSGYAAVGLGLGV